MPKLDPAMIALLTVIANVVVQAVKGPLSERARDYIPLVLLPLMALIGLGIAAAYGLDLIAGAIEGLLSGAAAVGIYKAASVVPGLNSILNTAGWFFTGGGSDDAG